MLSTKAAVAFIRRRLIGLVGWIRMSLRPAQRVPGRKPGLMLQGRRRDGGGEDRSVKGASRLRQCTLICPECGVRHVAPFLEIVDLVAEPEALTGLASRKIFETLCPNGHLDEFHEHVMVYGSGLHEHLLLFHHGRINQSADGSSLDKAAIDGLMDRYRRYLDDWAHSGSVAFALAHSHLAGLYFSEKQDLLQYEEPILALLAATNEVFDTFVAIGNKHGLFRNPKVREALEIVHASQRDTLDGRTLRRKLEALINFFASSADEVSPNLPSQEDLADISFDGGVPDGLEQDQLDDRWKTVIESMTSDEFNKMISQLRLAVELDLPDETKIAMLGQAGTLLLLRYQSHGVFGHLDQALYFVAAAEEVAADYPKHMLMLNHNKASLLSARYELTRDIADLESAISTLRPLVDADWPMRDWARDALGTSLRLRFEESADIRDIEEAAACAKAALQSSQSDPQHKVVMLNNVLGHIMRLYEVTKDAGVFGDAIEQFEAWIALLPARGTGVAGLKCTLAQAYFMRQKATRSADDLERANRFMRQAEEAVDPKAKTSTTIRHNFARMLFEQAIDRSDTSLQDDAIEKLQSCLDRTSRHDHLRVGILMDLCTVLMGRYRKRREAKDLARVRAYGEEALDLVEDAALSQEATTTEPTYIARLTRSIAHCCFESSDYDGMIVALERGRAVRMRDRALAMGTISQDLSKQDAEMLSVRARLKKVTADIIAFDVRSSTLDLRASQDALARLREEERELRQTLARTRSVDDARDIVGKVTAYLAEAADHAFVLLVPMGEEGLLTVLVTRKGLAEGLGARDVFHIPGWGSRELSAVLFADDASADLAGGWLSSYWAAQDGDPGRGKIWLDALQTVLGRLGAEIMQPISQRLTGLGVGRVVLVPSDRLAILPLHAAPLASGRRFDEQFEVTYAPSIHLFLLAVRHNAVGRNRRLVAVCNPDGSLPFAEMQMRTVEQTMGFETDIRYGRDCSCTGLQQASGEASILCFATHAHHALDRPERSAFLVESETGRGAERARTGFRSSRGASVTLHDVLRGDLPVRPGAIVVADACETGFVRPDMTIDEMLGFPSAFIASGATSVVSTFWSVSDFSSAIIMSEFYRRLDRGEPVAGALRNATRDVSRMTATEVRALVDRELARLSQSPGSSRIVSSGLLARLRNARRALSDVPADSKLFEHPFYWAGFGVSGDSALVPSREHGVSLLPTA